MRVCFKNFLDIENLHHSRFLLFVIARVYNPCFIFAHGLQIREIVSSWVRNEGAVFAIKRAMEIEPNLKVTL
jgi:hypothetical protein